MTAHADAAARPTLAPLWTGYEGFRRMPDTAFRTAQGPLLSPSPVSPRGLPRPRRPSSSEGFARKNNRALVANHAIGSSTVSSPRSFGSMERQSTLVSKLEEVSLRIADAGTAISAMPTSATERGSGATRATLRLEAREDYGNISTADAFVVARSIRQPANPTAKNSQLKPPNVLTLRAVIRPKAPERRAFLIQRNLDIDELQIIASIRSSFRSKASRKPLPVPARWSSNDRRPSMGLPSPESGRSSRRTSHAPSYPGYDQLIRGPKTVPIHIDHVNSGFPALAALLRSGHVHNGDVIYLPVPHAESWLQTVRYVYTGEGELTAAMRENIKHLGGIA
ncbi:hypothetical protein F5Y14DRAFT_432696 [Nemania sp. NC0429]|nr:hypothetical protein F5Y14DRAFT_432696 [Nemania sp. NC0429]